MNDSLRIHAHLIGNPPVDAPAPIMWRAYRRSGASNGYAEVWGPWIDYMMGYWNEPAK